MTQWRLLVAPILTVVLANRVAAAAPPAPNCSAANTIAYVGGNLSGSIYTMANDGTGTCKLVNDSAASHPAYFGSWIVYQTSTGGEGVYKVPITGGTPSLVVGRSSAFRTGTDASALRNWIVFTDTGVAGNQDVYVVRGDGSGLLNLTNDAADQYEPSLNANATRLAVSDVTTDSIVVYDLALDGSGMPFIIGETNVTALACSPLNDATVVWPRIARTSDRILLGAVLPGGNYLDLWRVDPADPCNPVRLTNTPSRPEAMNCWVSGDVKIVYRTTHGTKQVAHSANPDGTNETWLGGKSTQSQFGCKP